MKRIRLKNWMGLFMIMGIISCQNTSENTSETLQADASPEIHTLSPYLMDLPTFQSLDQDAEPFVLIDLRKEEDYVKGHIHGAIQIWRDDIQNQDSLYSGLMASKSQMEQLFSTLGIQNNSLIVIYDNKANVDAMRLWWILKNYGYSNVRMIDGGMKAWTDAGLALDTSRSPQTEATDFRFEQESDRTLYASRYDVESAIQSNILIIDTRSDGEFNGEYIKDGAFRAGHIPGSIQIDYANSFYYGASEKIKSMDELKYIYSVLGDDLNRPIINYCHSGVRSAHTTFILTELLGYTNVKNYDGSWVEWSYFDELPIESNVELKEGEI